MKRLIDLVRRYAGDAWSFTKLVYQEFVVDPVFGSLTIIFVVTFLLGVISIIVSHQDGDAREMDGSVVVFKVHGEAHEYLKYDRGLMHLPNCKFCKGEIK